MKNLVIVESPSKSKTIEKYLGPDFEVVSSVGHIRDLAIKGKDGLGIDIENEFKASYVISKDKKDVVKDLKKKVKKANFVFLATDPDREGEAISWHLADELDLDLSLKNRVVFNEITSNAVLEAFENPSQVDMDLVKSQETRRILDRIIGFKLSKLLQSKIKSKSAGRVQSVALNLIVEREKLINAFISEEYWTIHSDFIKDGYSIKSELSKIAGKKTNITNEEDAMKIVDACDGEFNVSTVKKTTKSKASKPPFITSTLQQEASTKLGFSAKKTMQVAQKLYEGISVKGEAQGLITYMRTDSTRLSDVFVKQAYAHIHNTYGKEYVGFYTGKKSDAAQDAHEAIRPSNLSLTPESIKSDLTSDQYKLYKFIYARTLASLMAKSKSSTVSITFNRNEYDFSANGSVLVFDGYLKVYSDYEQTKDEVLPEIFEGETYLPNTVEGKQHFTEPPLRYSEARLIKEMEELQIGRPSTYASIIDTIQVRGYTELKKPTETTKTRVFFPTERGVFTDEKLQDYFNSIINVKYTANMEADLDSIASGSENNIVILNDFYNKFIPLIENAYEKMEKKPEEKLGEACPECGEELLIREGRFGKFISCSAFPKCRYTRKINDGTTKEEPEKTGEQCPDCGGDLIKRKSRYGTFFIGCSNYPKCKHIINVDKDGNKEVPEPTGEICPDCGKDLVKKKGRFGKFYVACSDYPKCKHVKKDETSKTTTKKKTVKRKSKTVSKKGKSE